ncbi:MAG: amino acid adenylation domain-containing protein, partial [Cyclobacteriaceae bacterium]
FSHQIYPFDRLVEDLGLQRDTSRHPVFDVMLVLSDNVDGVEINEEDIHQIVNTSSQTSKFDLILFVHEVDGYYSYSMEYNTDVYEAKMIEGLMRHYRHLISECLSNPDIPLADIDYLSQAERAMVLDSFNATEVAYSNRTIKELLEEQVNAHPDKPALVFEEQMLTYQEINAWSNSLANCLVQDHKIAQSTRVGVLLNRSVESVVSMLAIIKTGACYVSIDPNYPTDRVAYIVEDSAVDVIISTKQLFKKHKIESAKLLDLTENDLERYDKENLSAKIDFGDECYVIYTSGSTGTPKGVVQTHRMMTNLVQWDVQDSGLERNLKHLQYVSFSFDVHTQDCWSALCGGGTIYLVHEAIRLDFPALWTFIQKNSIEVLSFPFSAFRQLISQNSHIDLALPALRHLICSGEQLIISPLIQRFFEKNPQIYLHNHYGPSETQLVTSYTLKSSLGIHPETEILIGGPVSNCQIYILDKNLQPVAPGVEGELYIAGFGLAKGYLNKEELTAERFVKNPFIGGYMYRSGDLGRWTESGEIRYTGRIDDQVKVRGYRIELGEIEQALLSHEEIDQAVIVIKMNNSGEQDLLAYVISDLEQNITALRSFLRAILPEYMLPTHYIQISELPLTSNGKLNKRALPSPEGLGLSSGVEYVDPGNDEEVTMVRIWEQILQREKIGINDDFFALGGHSLRAVRLSNEYQKIFDVRLSLKDLFSYTSISTQSKLIQSASQEAFARIESIEVQANYAISDAQRRIWVLSQFEDGSIAYNLPTRVRLMRELNIDNFKVALSKTIDRHEILRTVFKENDQGEIRQWILNPKELNFELSYVDYRTATNTSQLVDKYIKEDAGVAFDLEKGPLFRATLFHLAESNYVFYFTMHHIISDEWSMNVLSKDVFAFYEAGLENRKPELNKLAIQYKDYSYWQLAQVADTSFAGHRSYWLDSLSGELPVLSLHGSKQRPKIKTHNGRILYTYLDKETTAELKVYSRKYGGSLFMALLTSWNILMYRYTSQKDLITGTPVAGRDHSDLEDQIGFYVNTLALRNKIDPSGTFHTHFEEVKDNTLKAYSHQMYPFDRLVGELNIRKDPGRSPVFDVMLTQRSDSEGIETSEVTANRIFDGGNSISKFDIEINFQEVGDYLSIKFLYNPDVYEYQIISDLIKNKIRLLRALLENPDRSISKIDFLSNEDKTKLLLFSNGVKVDYPEDKTIIDLFEKQVVQTPDNIAISYENIELTYKELNEQSNQLAHYLSDKYDINQDNLVGIKQERSELLMISILGILKSGGAYVPIDPDHPQERIDEIREDSQIKVLLNRKELEIFEKSQHSYSTDSPTPKTSSSDLAYVIYTSGSTGKPKGVLLEHKGLVNRLIWMQRDLEIDQSDVFIQKTPISFDVSVWELFLPIISGSKLVLPKQGGHKDPLYLRKILKEQRISIIHFVPSMLSAILDDIPWEELSYLRHVICSGEVLPKSLEDAFGKKSSTCNLHNYYGPTEATVDVTSVNLSQYPSEGNEVSIGKPVPNTRIYIVNEAITLQAIGVSGEILIGGDQVARGYINRKELTEERFISSPFRAGERLYKTGDLGRWRADGNIEFIGRIDDQVKIRGHRIELGE